jgi:acyl-coenzyme A thioesterase 13
MTDAERSQRVAERIAKIEAAGFDRTCGFRAVSWGEGRARVEMTVAEAVHNVNGMLHGGATAALVDNAGTLAIISIDREARPGVTTDLNVTYLSPGPGGDVVIAEAQVLKIGKTMAFVTVDVRRKSDGALVAQGRMTKFQG